MENDPTNATAADLSSTTAVSAGSQQTTGGRVQVIDDWMNYVTVTINTDGLTQKYTVNGQSVDELSDLVVGGYAGLGAAEKFEIKVDNGSGYAVSDTVNDGDDVKVKVRMDDALDAAAGDGYGLELTLATADPVTHAVKDEIGTVTVLNNDKNDSTELTLKKVSENLEIVITDVEVLNALTIVKSDVTYV